MITRVNETSRMVSGKIFFEKPDRYDYILGYNPDAFITMMARSSPQLIRQMFDPSKSVGRLLEIVLCPDEYAIEIISRVSPSTPETLQQIVNGELSAYSVAFIPGAGFGGNPAHWPKKMHEGKEYPYLPHYDVTGISYIGKPPESKASLVVI